MALLDITEKPKIDQCDIDLISKALAKNFPRSLYGDKKARINWGYLYRACRRLYATGYLRSYTLRKSGKLSVSFDTDSERKLNNFVIIPKHNVEYLFPSQISPNEKREDKRKENIIIVLRPNTGKRFTPYDYTPSRLLVNDRLQKDHTYLHSEEARLERVRKMQAESSACNKWGEKFKIRTTTYYSDVTFALTLKDNYDKICTERGYCIWPSPLKEELQNA
jgi:hypothetical protein